MKQKKILKRMLSVVLAVALIVPTAWVPAENNAKVATAASNEVYVSANGSDSASGTEAEPLKSLAKAMELVTSGGTIHIKDTCETGSWSAHGKNITITGGTLNFTTGDKTLGGLGDTLTFKNITLGVQMDVHQELYANGCKLTMGEDVELTNSICLFGGPQSGTLNGDTNLQVYSGDYYRIYGGGRDNTTTKGNTNVIVGGNVCSQLDATDHDGNRLFFGGGRNDVIEGYTKITFKDSAKATFVYGGTYNSIPTIESKIGKGSYLIFEGGQAVGLYGGSKGANTENANLLMTGGTVEQVFGGNEKANLTGNVDVRVLGGTVTRRIYGGCYNEYSASFTTETNYSVNGNIKLTIGGNAEITYAWEPDEFLGMQTSGDEGVFACSRLYPQSENENTTLIYDVANEEDYNTYAGLVGPEDDWCKEIMEDAAVANNTHYYTYTANDEANTITATCKLCADSHESTATLRVIKEEFVYAGDPIEGAQIVYDETWNAAPLEIEYTGNDKDGTATATCTKNGVSVSVNFKIKSTVLSGKFVSVMGDSISTFDGVSNNASNNKTIGGNAVYYPRGNVQAKEDTYWGQLIEKTGMKLCVNNSWSGSKTINYGTEASTPAIRRCTELHNNDGQEPDIILVNTGTNDLWSDQGKFVSAYKQMIDSMLNRYEEAEIFCFTLLAGRGYISYERRISEYNEQITKIVNGYEERVHLIDMHTESGISWNNLNLYMCDYSDPTVDYPYPWGLHPNATGMEKMAKVIERALLDVYEPASLPKTPEVYFDLEIDIDSDIKQVRDKTNNARVTSVGDKAEIKTMTIEKDGQICEVPVFYAGMNNKEEKDVKGSDSYLKAEFPFGNTSDDMKNWIKDGITFETFLYVENAVAGWGGIMSNVSGGSGISLYSVDKGGIKEYPNFFIGTTKPESATHAHDGGNKYAMAMAHITTDTYKLNKGTFVHVVGTYDASTKMMSLYYDGVKIGEGKYDAADFKSGTRTNYNQLGIGTNIGVNTECLDDGTDYAIADARVYSGSLTEDQVKQEYNNRWNEVLETATGPEVYFDLDFENNEIKNAGTDVGIGIGTDATNPSNIAINPVGEGTVDTMTVVKDGQVCEVPVYKAQKSTDVSKRSYLEVTFSDITSEAQMKKLISSRGVSFECFIYVKDLPTRTTGFMTNLNGGGIGLYSRGANAELNFQMGTTNPNSATYRFTGNYVTAFPSPTSDAPIIQELQLTKNHQSLDEGKLTHVVGTYDSKNKVMSIYKDGQLLSSASYGDGEFKKGSATFNQLGLGCNIAFITDTDNKDTNNEWLNYYTDYAIADARVYSSALTAEQVAEQYNNRWDEVAANKVSDVEQVEQLDNLNGYDMIEEGEYQELEGLPRYYYGGIDGTYEGSTTADRAAIDDNDHTLHVFNNTTPDAYVSYLKSLEADGWTQYSNNIIEKNNLFATYIKDGKSVYAYYIASKASTYIVVSDTCNLENRKKDNQYKEICDPLFTEVKNISSSQCEIVRLSDGRFIIIDSGNRETDHYQAKRIYEILKKQNVLDKITVAAWIITHPHMDHMNACADFLTEYDAGDLDIEEIIFNYPNKTDRLATNDQAELDKGKYTECTEPEVETFFAGLAAAKEKWSELKIITCHTGQEYHIADATIEILHTVEDYFPKKPEDLANLINDTSVPFKIKIAGQEIMILGDSATDVSNELVDMWGDYLKADFVQMSHHGMHGGSVELYEHIDPTVVTITSSRSMVDPDSNAYIANYEATAWALHNFSQNIKEVVIAGYGTRTFTLPYTPKNENYISNINDNGYDMKEAEKVKAEIPEPYMDLVFDSEAVTDEEAVTDAGKANNTPTMIGGSVGENTVYYQGKPYTVTSYRGEKTSSNYNYIHLTMNDITSADDLKKLLTENGHSLEMFFALDNQLPQIGGLMASCYSGGVALYARKLGVLGYQLGNSTGSGNTYCDTNYVYAGDKGQTTTSNMAVGKTVTHVIATYDKEAGKLKIYQNGVLISEGTYNNPENYQGHDKEHTQYYNQMGIGANVALTSEAIGMGTGYTIIKSRIYDQSLSAEQVKAEYWSCIEDLTGDENIYDDWDPEKIDDMKKVTVPFTNKEVETFLEEKTYPTRKGYLFAGWYTTTDIPEIDPDPEKYDASAREAMKVAIIDSVPDEFETVYALFVPEEVLTVKAQISGNLIDEKNDNDTTGSIRFVTTVDSLMYRQVGFKVEYTNTNNEPKTLTSVSKTVYEKLNAVDIEGKVVKELSYLPTQFCSVSKYFKACTVTNLSADKFSRQFTVTPFWVTMDGSYIYGEPVVKSIQQYLDTLK